MGKKSKKPSKQAPKPKAPPAVPPAEAVPIESAQIYSAHKTIAVYQGTEDGVATFGVATYLRYAKADASKAEEPRHDLSLPLAEADAHTALLSESAEGAISSVVASLTAGDRVELEWLQMRLPGAAFDSNRARLPEARACHGGRGEGADRAVVPEGAGTWISVGRAAAGADLRAVQAGQAAAGASIG